MPDASDDASHAIESEDAVRAVNRGPPGAVGGVRSLECVGGGEQARVLIDPDARDETLPFVSDASTPIVNDLPHASPLSVVDVPDTVATLLPSA